MSIISSYEIFRRLNDGLELAAAPWRGEGAQAGVLVALTDELVPHVLLGRRAMHLRLHPGEIAFPGGKRELEDHSPWATALREAQEEVGFERSWATPLGELTPMQTRSGFEVHPCIAKVPATLEFTVDSSEFDSIFLAPLEQFGDRSIFELKEIFDGSHTRMVPHYQIGSDNVWGVTAAVLAQLANLAFETGFDLKRDWKKKP